MDFLNAFAKPDFRIGRGLVRRNLWLGEKKGKGNKGESRKENLRKRSGKKIMLGKVK